MEVYGCIPARLSGRIKDKTYEQIRRVIEKLRKHSNGEIPEIKQAFEILKQSYTVSLWTG